MVQLHERYRDIRDTLGFLHHAGPEPVPLWPGSSEPASLQPRAERFGAR
jgi:hypothetical protein